MFFCAKKKKKNQKIQKKKKKKKKKKKNMDLDVWRGGRTGALEAVPQLLDRRIGFGHSEPMFGAIVEPRRGMFWRFENHEASNLLRISRWPAEPLPLQERVDDRPSGLDHLAALCRTPATYLRPSTAQGDFVALLDGLRAELRLGERPMVPVVPLNLGRPVVLNVYSFPSEGDARRSADPTDVIKMWRAGLERRANMEL